MFRYFYVTREFYYFKGVGEQGGVGWSSVRRVGFSMNGYLKGVIFKYLSVIIYKKRWQTDST